MADDTAPVTAEPAARPRRRRRGLIAIVLALAVILLGLAGMMAYYATTRRPVTELPVIQQVTKEVPPRRLFSFVGAARPVGLAVTPDGQRIYVAEGGGDRLIKVFDRDGRPVGQLAPTGSTPGTRSPGHMAVDGRGRLYVVDRLRAAVDLYTSNLQWEGPWTPPVVDDLGGWLPNGISIGLDGRFYVSEVGQEEHSVLILNPDGSLEDRLGKSSGLSGGLNYPIQAVVDDQGRVYVSDGNGGRIVVLSPQGASMIASAGGTAIGLPRGLAVWGQKLFVADAVAQRVLTFALGDRPQFLYAFGDTGDREGLAFPNAVSVDRSGRIYVADRANDRVQIWTH